MPMTSVGMSKTKKALGNSFALALLVGEGGVTRGLTGPRLCVVIISIIMLCMCCVNMVFIDSYSLPS